MINKVFIYASFLKIAHVLPMKLQHLSSCFCSSMHVVKSSLVLCSCRLPTYNVCYATDESHPAISGFTQAALFLGWNTTLSDYFTISE